MKISATKPIGLKQKDNTSFNGLKRAYNSRFNDVYRFYAPPYDKKKQVLLLELCAIKEDGKGGFVVDTESGQPFIYNDSYNQFFNSGVVDYPRDTYISDPEKSKFMGYRFILADKSKFEMASKCRNSAEALESLEENKEKFYINDPGVRAGFPGGKGAFTVISNNMGMTPKSGSATHIFYDSFDTAKGVDKKTFRRNHFNKAGGDLDGIGKYKNEIDSYRYVMTNPYIGNDSISSHKYWGENFYRCPSPAKFRNLIVDLFKEGKGYIADGAFTSQSLQSPLFQDVLKYGKKSPYYNWFKINADRVKVGVFPDAIYSSNPNRENPAKHIGFKIVNRIDAPDYDPKKPSYIQFFDDRLASYDQQTDTKNLITRYANSNPQDPYEVTTHQDSILPYSFELDYSDKTVVERFSGYDKAMLTDRLPVLKGKNNRILDNMDSFFAFKHYDITRKGRSGGANFWDGNVDIVKMNLSNPNPTDGNAEGNHAAREYLWGAATYWTKFANDALYETLVKAFSENDEELIRQIAEKNDISQDDINGIAKHVEEYNIAEDHGVNGAKARIFDSIENFRYESLEVSPQLQAIVSSPFFKEYMNGEKAKEALYENVLEILRKLEESTNEKIITPTSVSSNKDGLGVFTGEEAKDVVTLTPFGHYMLDILADRIIGYCVLQAMFYTGDKKQPVINDIYVDTQSGLVQVSDEIKQRSLYETGIIKSGKPDDEARQLAVKITKVLNNENFTKPQQDKLVNTLEKSPIKDYDLQSFRAAKAFLKKTGAGLNWRFDAAKDVADLTANRNGIRTFEDSWDDVIDFWGGFVKNVHKINPSSYIIAEVTNLWDFYDVKNYKTETIELIGKGATPNQIDAVAEQIRDLDWGKYVHPDVAERMLYEKTGATTGSQYSTFFGLIPNTFGQNFEHGNMTGSYANMGSLKENFEKFLKTGPILSLTHSHIFFDNHDKPRGMHCLALDMGAYLSRFGINPRPETNQDDIERAKQAAMNVLGVDREKVENRAYLDKLNSKAIVVGDTFKNNFAEVVNDKQKLDIINEAIKDLSLGMFKEKNVPDDVRAEAFGQNPFDISIKDVLEQAEYIAKRDNLEWFDKDEQKKLADDVFIKIMKPAMDTMEKISDYMCALTGVPFFYAGNNMAQSGYEYSSKNIAVANRNLIRHEWIDPKSDEYKPEVRKFYNRMQASAGLYKKYGLSAIAGGTPISLPQGNEKDLYAIFKYDASGSNVIQVISNIGLKKDAKKPPFLEAENKRTVSGIKLTDEENNVVYNPVTSGSSTQFLRRKVYNEELQDFVDETKNGIVVEYSVADGQLVRNDGDPIEINDTVSIFYKPLGIGKVSEREIYCRR